MTSRALVRHLVGVLLLLFSTVPASATNRTVTNLNDSGAGSLRAVIAASGNGDSVNFSVLGTITLTTAELLVSQNITINGPGAGNLTITRSSAGGTPAFRIFDISNGTGNGPTVSISGLTISNGLASGSSGGGVLNLHGTTTLTSCLITGNDADHVGGGAFNEPDDFSATMTVTGCTFSNNTAVEDGGGIFNGGGNLTITGSTFTGNSAGTSATISGGGAIYNVSGSCTIRSSIFTSNQGLATGRGGAIFNTGAELNVIESTLNGNAATGGGGAIYNQGAINATTVTLTNCTLTDNTGNGAAAWNTAPPNGTANLTFVNCTISQTVNPTPSGGSVIRNSPFTTSATLTLAFGNTIIYKAPGTSGANIVGGGTGTVVNSMGYNLCSDNGGGFFTATGDQINTDPKLDPAGLQYNGGTTPTIALTYGSPAIDKGYNFLVTVDQREQPRPFDNPSIPNAPGGDGSDIGAYEAPADPLQSGIPSFVVNTTADHNDGLCSGADCTLREAVQRSNALPGANTITFAGNVTPTITLQAALGELVITDDTIITGPAAGILAISGGSAHRIFNISGGTSTISGLTIRDGVFSTTQNHGENRQGGAVYNLASVTFSNCAFTNNFVNGAINITNGGNGGSGLGGAIYSNGNQLTLNGCTFNGNAAGGAAGATNTNQIGSGGHGGAGQGGAVYNETTGSLVINNCTFNGNTGSGGAGGNGHFGGAGGNGSGAVFSLNGMTVTSATISGNTGTGGAGGGSGLNTGPAGIGVGGLAAGGGTSTVGNTICAGNTGNFGGGNDVNGAFSTAGYNLIGKNDGAATSFPAGNPNGNNDLVGTSSTPIDPKLGPLQQYYGQTATMPLLYLSPALDKGKSLGLTTDQRGSLRPVDTVFANASGGDGSDIGAMEMNLLGGPDTDDDFMSDDYEIFYGFNPNDGSDATVDSDGDGLTNYQEFKAGTDPRDASSKFGIAAIAKSGNDFVVTFSTAIVGKSYRLERKDALTDPTWSSITGVPDFSPTSVGSGQITDPGGASTTKRFYRIRVLP